MVARRENIYNMQLKQQLNYVNLTTAQLNYKSSMTKLFEINSIMQQNTIQEINTIRPIAKNTDLESKMQHIIYHIVVTMSHFF